MRASAPLLTVVGTAVGAVAAVLAYQAGAGGATETASTGKDQVPESTAVAPTSTKPTFLPCEKGTRLRKGVCVRVEKKVIVVLDPAPVAPAGLVPATTPRTGTGDGTGHGSGDERTRARPGPAEQADDDDRDEMEHSEDHDSEDGDEVEDHHDEDDHEVEPED